MTMQPRVGEYVMNISLDFRAQHKPTRKEGLNLAAETQELSPFVTPSLKKTSRHIGIKRPFQVNLIFFLSGVWEHQSSIKQSSHPPPESSRQTDFGDFIFLVEEEKKPRKERDRTALPCGIIHFTLIPASYSKLYLNKHRDRGFQRQSPAAGHGELREGSAQGRAESAPLILRSAR